MKLARIGVAVASLAALAAFVGVGLPEGAQGTSDPTDHGITVSGNGKVTTVPDRAQFCFDVENNADTADAASAANAAGMQKVIDALRDAGVASKDMQTVNLSVSPLYNDDGSKVLGYVATNSVCATTEVADAGSIVDTGLGAGADRVSGPTLTKADTDTLYANALRAAVADARGRAEVLAAAAGVKLGQVISMAEGSEPSGPIPYALTDARASAPIEPGTQDIEADVTVTFAIA